MKFYPWNIDAYQGDVDGCPSYAQSKCTFTSPPPKYDLTIFTGLSVQEHVPYMAGARKTASMIARAVLLKLPYGNHSDNPPFST